MIGRVGWAVLAAAVVLLVVCGSRPRSMVASAATILAWLRAHPLGRLALFGVWVFLGIHFFARATIAR